MTVQFRTLDNGAICCSSINSKGEHVAPIHACDKCKAHFAAQERTMYAPPDPYAGISALRAATATPEQTFEERWKADRLRALTAEHTRLEALIAASPRMTAAGEADRAKYTPPDPYAAGIKALREKEARR